VQTGESYLGCHIHVNTLGFFPPGYGILPQRVFGASLVLLLTLHELLLGRFKRKKAQRKQEKESRGGRRENCIHTSRGVTPAMRNGKFPLVKLTDGSAYEGEWHNDKVHGRGIFTRADGHRLVRRGCGGRGVAAAGRCRARAGVRVRQGEGCACP
jgi:hypothetical protein